MRPTLGFVVVALALAACSSGSEARERDAAGRLVRSIQLLRDASNADKEPALKALEAASCYGESACSLRNICARAYRQHVDALALTQVARSRLAMGKSTDAMRLLLAAEAALREAQGKVSACIDAESALRRRYKL